MQLPMEGFPILELRKPEEGKYEFGNGGEGDGVYIEDS